MEPQSEEQEPVIRVARRLYVGNLPWKTSWQDLKDYFSQVGTVRYADILREGGPGTRSKGCGIVEFESPEEALAAIQRLNHTELDGRQIFVREDREDYELKGEAAPLAQQLAQQEQPRSGVHKRLRGMTGGQMDAGALSIGRRVYVANLSFDTTWQQLKDHFKQAGHVARADILEDGEGRSKGCALVEYDFAADALRSISLLSNSMLNGRQIMVREDREDPAAGGGSGRRLGAGGGGGAAPHPGSIRGGGRPAEVSGAEPGAGSSPPASRAEAAQDPWRTQVVVHGIPFRMAWQELKDVCRQVGQVVRAHVPTNPDGTSKGYGLVQFASAQDAAAAIAALNGRILEGRVLSVRYDRFAPGGGDGEGGGDAR